MLLIALLSSRRPVSFGAITCESLCSPAILQTENKKRSEKSHTNRQFARTMVTKLIHCALMDEAGCRHDSSSLLTAAGTFRDLSLK
jgi:hypothetical protein